MVTAKKGGDSADCTDRRSLLALEAPPQLSTVSEGHSEVDQWQRGGNLRDHVAIESLPHVPIQGCGWVELIPENASAGDLRILQAGLIEEARYNVVIQAKGVWVGIDAVGQGVEVEQLQVGLRQGRMGLLQDTLEGGVEDSEKSVRVWEHA